MIHFPCTFHFCPPAPANHVPPPGSLHPPLPVPCTTNATAPGGAWQLWYDGDEDADGGADDPDVTREERGFRRWLASLGLPTRCGSLFGPEVRSGWLLLEVLDHLQVAGARAQGAVFRGLAD